PPPSPEYDEDGNAKKIGTSTATYQPRTNRLESLTTPAPQPELPTTPLPPPEVREYAYHSDGSRKQEVLGQGGLPRDISTYDYDVYGRLTNVSIRSGILALQGSAKTISYKYDVFGNRIEQVVRESSDPISRRGPRVGVLRSVYAGQEVRLDLSSANDPGWYYLRGDGTDQRFGFFSARGGEFGGWGGTKLTIPWEGFIPLAGGWYVTDRLNSVSYLLDIAGVKRTRGTNTIEPWGVFGTEYSAGSASRFGFTGREVDTAVGLQYNRARYYDYRTRQWISEDPLGLAAGDTNLYRYVGNSPANFTDPSGKIINVAIGAGFGTVIGGIAGGINGYIESGGEWSAALEGAGKGAVLGAVAGGVAGATFGVGLAAGGALFGTGGTAAAVGSFAVAGAGSAAAGDIAMQATGIGLGWQKGGYNWRQTAGAAVGGAVGGGLAGSIMSRGVTAAGRAAWMIDCAQVSRVTAGGVQILSGGVGGAAGSAATQGFDILSGHRTSFDWGEVGFAGLTGMAAAGAAVGVFGTGRVCFAAGTPLRTPDGAKRIEEFRVGDEVLSRDEFDADGPVTAKLVEEVFVREGLVWNLHVGGQVIRTTAEHPFYAAGKGWVACQQLAVGDRLLAEDGSWVAVEDLLDTGEWETVYNLRIVDYHTYFVGCEEWGFSAWVHNANGYSGPEQAVASAQEVATLQGLEQRAIAARRAVATERTNHGNRTYRVGFTQEQLLDPVVNPAVAAEHVESGIRGTGVALGDRRATRPAILTTTDDLPGASGSFSYHAEGKASFRVVGQMQEQQISGGTLRMWIDTPNGPCADFCRGMGGLQTVSDRTNMVVQAYYRDGSGVVQRLTYTSRGGRGG
ncbi:MAG TPA: polymorphic toxin-type HINT domain-containing protein, partial [Urbifossiella sp.]|nr:polymorphic toxin-type HINT domain-containing protein [Urbifossiella sp.]